ncbi:hypothetical protein [Agrobacterium fabrum]|uniref:hypothetical protein n=1 Tax=Agrobacterium fabrum TaxID=1176649 RepID=UPI000B85763D|nr:hypothetical protein [Agrobacterium fabrum]
MNKKQENLGYWAGWFIAFGIAGFFFIYVISQSASLRDLACGVSDINCFREWLSASGGWVTLAAAVPTLLYLSRQIREADRHHRTSTALHLRRLRVIAANIGNLGEQLYAQTHMWMALWNGARTVDLPVFRESAHMIGHIDATLTMLIDKNIDAFEAEIYLPLTPIAFLRSELQKIRMELEHEPAELERHRAIGIAKKLHEFQLMIQEYAEDVKRNAALFLRETEDFASWRLRDNQA